MTSYRRGSIKAGVAAGVEDETSDSRPERTARVQQGKKKREEAERSGDGLKSSQCLASPGGDTSDPLSQIKQSANIFQPFCRGTATSVDSERLTPEYKQNIRKGCLMPWASDGLGSITVQIHTGHRLCLHATVQDNDIQSINHVALLSLHQHASRAVIPTFSFLNCPTCMELCLCLHPERTVRHFEHRNRFFFCKRINYRIIQSPGGVVDNLSFPALDFSITYHLHAIGLVLLTMHRLNWTGFILVLDWDMWIYFRF